MEEVEKDFNAYIGTETGILKGVNLNQNAVIHKNFHKIKALERDQEITSMAWGNEDQTEILMGLRNQTIRTFDTTVKAFVSLRKISVGEGPIVSLARYDGVTITAVKSGQVTLWRGESPVEINALTSGEFLTRMRQDPASPNMIATGGKENELQVWDLEHPAEPIFQAKNVKPDMLQLRVPVWVSDIAFLEEKHCVAVSSRYKHVRLYDPQRQRRPVLSFEWEESPLTCINSVSSNCSQVLVGTAHGRIGLFDLRGKKPEVPLFAYKGFAGAVRDVVVHPKHPFVFSVSLDRFLRVHHLTTTKLLFKEYLKSRLNCLLVTDDLDVDDFIPPIQKPRKRKMKVSEAEPAKKPELANSKIPDNDWESLTK
nr:WD repeat-containing protein 74-like [Cherax quadricarinatus]